MELVMAILVGLIFGAGIYLVLHRGIIRVLFGIMLISHAMNMFVFSVPGIRRGEAPILGEEVLATAAYSDPLPQALILTALVIGLGIQAFAFVLIMRTYQRTQTTDMEDMK